ncbi:hypothetical protein OQA88_199 [Cercophora sp. LCS_1]
MLKAALTGPWVEASDGDADRLYKIDAEDWDVDSLVIVMNAIHGLWPKVPRAVDLIQLCKIAIIINYYQVQSALEIITPMWIKTLRHPEEVDENAEEYYLPESYGEELISWMCIGWVFKDAGIFRETTFTALRTCRSEVKVGRLPNPV